MQIIRQLSRSFAPLALAALATSSVATAEVSGSGAGQWVKVSPRSTNIQAVLGHRDDARAYMLDALLLGAGHGQILGTIEEMPSDKSKAAGGKQQGKLVHLVYDVRGDFVDYGDGVIYVQAQILLDLVPYGGKDIAIVGVLDGMLLGTDAGGYCPVLPPAGPMGDDDLHPIGSGRAGKSMSLAAREPSAVSKPDVEPMLSGKFIAEWRMF